MAKTPEFTVSLESLQCASVIPSARCVSSRDVGWTSLLIDHHIGATSTEPYRSVATDDIEIGVATWGRYASEILHGGRWYRGVYHAGAVCLHPTGESRTIRFEAFRNIESSTAMMYLPHAQVHAAAEHLRRAGQPASTPAFNQPVERDPAISQMTVSLVRAMQQGADDLYAQTAAAWLAVHLATHYGACTAFDQNRHGGTIADKRLVRVIEFMSVHFAEPLTLEQLAAEACVSKFHFTRMFRIKVGRTPHSFLTTLRLEAAYRMLIGSEVSVAEVGVACGYPIPSHFSAAFTKKYGITPTGLRARNARC